MNKIRFGICGSGHLATIVANCWLNGMLEEYELVGIYGRNHETCKALADKCNVKCCDSVEELLALDIEIIAEACGISFLKDHLKTILSAKVNIVCISIGVFENEEFRLQCERLAYENNVKIYIASGAVGGFDVLQTMSLMGNCKAVMNTQKGPKSLRNTSLYNENLIDNERVVFSGLASEAIKILPTKVNVSIANSLASVGPSNLNFHITSTPDFVGDDHKMTCCGDGLKATIDIFSATSDIAGYSIVRVLKNRVATFVF